MAPVMFRAIFVITTLITLCSSLRIEINPDRFNLVTTKGVDVSCVTDTDDDTVRQVVLLKIVKDDDTGNPLTQMRKGSKPTIQKDSEKTHQAVGHIGDNINKTYLNLTLLKPRKKDAGIYTCVMYFLDQSSVFHEHKAIGNLTQQKLDTAAMENILETLIDKISSLEHDMEIQSIKGSMFQNKLSVLEEKSEYQFGRISNMDENNYRILSDIARLEGATKNHSLLIDLLNEKDTDAIAFSATNRFYLQPPANGETLIFPDVIINQGQGYNATTGIFTVPKSGIYALNLFLTTTTEHFVQVRIQSRDKILANTYVGDNGHPDQSAISTVVYLDDGQEVRLVKVSSSIGTNIILKQFSEFTGYLIKVIKDTD